MRAILTRSNSKQMHMHMFMPQNKIQKLFRLRPNVHNFVYEGAWYNERYSLLNDEERQHLVDGLNLSIVDYLAINDTFEHDEHLLVTVDACHPIAKRVLSMGISLNEASNLLKELREYGYPDIKVKIYSADWRNTRYSYNANRVLYDE